ncbi:MAG: hypothetical protein ABI551_13540 [Polyangiaceae bacterium]
MRNKSLKLGAASACLAIIVGAFTGCSVKSSSGTSSAASSGAGGGGSRISSCSQIPLADFQALIPQKITSVFGTTIGGCQAKLGSSLGIAAQIYTQDADKSTYGPGLYSPTPHSISGIGEMAYWTAGTTGATGPNLHAHKGKVTCEIDSNAPPHTTMKTTPNGKGSYTVTDADQAAYAALMGKLCNDFFAVQ